MISTTNNNDDFGTVTKDSHFPKHSTMIVVCEPRFMRRGHASRHAFFTQLVVA